MTILIGDTGKTAHGTLKTFNISIPAAREVSLGSSTLPSSEGATNQVSFTVQTSDLPTITPSTTGLKYLAVIIVGGKSGVAATTVNYRLFKNGSSLLTSNASHLAGQYWTQTHWRWFDVANGDVLEVRNWANVADATIDYCAIQIYPVNLFVSASNVMLKDLTLGATLQPAITGAGVRSVLVGLNNAYSLTPTSISTINANVTTTAPVLGSIVPNPSFGIVRVTTGELNATSTGAANHASLISYQRNCYPSSISFREVLR